MDEKTVSQILEQTAYIRTGGSPEELRCAQYIADFCRAMDSKPQLTPFSVDVADIKSATLHADGVQIPCKGYLCSG